VREFLRRHFADLVTIVIEVHDGDVNPACPPDGVRAMSDTQKDPGKGASAARTAPSRPLGNL
jgi:hypothetical protein